MPLPEKQRLCLACVATALTISGIWWYGLDFAMQAKLARVSELALNRGYDSGRLECADMLNHCVKERNTLREKLFVATGEYAP